MFDALPLGAPLPPIPLPGLTGEALRITVIVSTITLICCSIYVADRLRRQIPHPAHVLLWAYASATIGVLIGVVANALTTPPTTGLYGLASGTAVGAGLAVWATVQVRRL